MVASEYKPQIPLATRTRELLAAGHSCARRGDLRRAVEAYSAAVAEQSNCPDTHFNLGVVLHQLQDVDGALQCLMRAWQVDAAFTNAAKGCMSLIASRVRSGYRWPKPPLQKLPAQPPSVAVIVCSIDDQKAASTLAMYRRLLEGVPHTIDILRDALSLAEAYNRGVSATRSDLVILSHDDIDVVADDFAARLLAHLRTFDVVGVVGASRATGPVPVWAGHPWVSGWITHHGSRSPDWTANTLGWQSVTGGMQVLDGVLLAARREVFSAVPFDAQTFDGFHGYDVDWSFRAASAGWSLAAAGDLRIVHASGGNYDAVWSKYAARLCEKHRTGAVPAAPSPYFAVNMKSIEETSALFDGLMHIASEAASPTPP